MSDYVVLSNLLSFSVPSMKRSFSIPIYLILWEYINKGRKEGTKRNLHKLFEQLKRVQYKWNVIIIKLNPGPFLL